MIRHKIAAVHKKVTYLEEVKMKASQKLEK